MGNRSPIGWALQPFKKYAVFRGRAPRAEFWWFWLFALGIWLAIYFVLFGTIMSSMTSQTEPSAGFIGAVGGLGILLFLFWLALIIPSISVQVRRLHDTNRSGWWLGGFYLLYAVYLAVFIGSFGSIAMLGTDDPSTIAGPAFWLSAFLGFALFVYVVVLLVFYCLPGTKGANAYGPDPYGEDIEQVFA